MHANELKVYRSDKDIYDSFIKWTKETYGYATKLNPPRGKIHDYLSLILGYTKPGEVIVYMKEYMNKIIEELTFMERAKNVKIVNTPEAEYLSTVNPNTTNMDTEKADVLFYNL